MGEITRLLVAFVKGGGFTPWGTSSATIATINNTITPTTTANSQGSMATLVNH
jgi:hypothetical protein